MEESMLLIFFFFFFAGFSYWFLECCKNSVMQLSSESNPWEQFQNGIHHADNMKRMEDMILKLCEYWTISVVKYSMILELCEYLTWPPAMEMKTVILEVHECMNFDSNSMDRRYDSRSLWVSYNSSSGGWYDPVSLWAFNNISSDRWYDPRSLRVLDSISDENSMIPRSLRILDSIHSDRWYDPRKFVFWTPAALLTS